MPCRKPPPPRWRTRHILLNLVSDTDWTFYCKIFKHLLQFWIRSSPTAFTDLFHLAVYLSNKISIICNIFKGRYCHIWKAWTNKCNLCWMKDASRLASFKPLIGTDSENQFVLCSHLHYTKLLAHLQTWVYVTQVALKNLFVSMLSVCLVKMWVE